MRRLTKQVGCDLTDGKGINGDEIENLSLARLILGRLPVLLNAFFDRSSTVGLVRLVLLGVHLIRGSVERVERSSNAGECLGGLRRVGPTESLGEDLGDDDGAKTNADLETRAA